MNDFLQLLKDFLPVEVALIAAVFVYLIFLLRNIAEKFISVAEKQAQLAETQTKYLNERLDVVEKTLGISDRAFDFQEKQIKKLEAITHQLKDDLKDSIEAKRIAEDRLKDAEERYQEAFKALNLKGQQVLDIQKAQTRVELTSRAEAITNLAHDLLLSIQAVFVNAENIRVAEELGLSSEERTRNAEQIINQMQRLAMQLQNARLSAGVSEKEIYNPTRFSLLGLLKECVGLFADIAHAKKVTLDLQSVTADDFIRGDESKLRLAFCNVIGNAVKYSFNGTVIMLRIQGDDDSFHVIVVNIGIGIEPKEFDYIFMPGYRTFSSRDRYRTGAGMGLFVARELITAHSGQIKVQSSDCTDQGSKTVFEIILPRNFQKVP